MARLPRFEQHRFVGFRDSMIVFDTDDAAQAGRAVPLLAAADRLGVSTFAPDTLAEARNRGFRPLPEPRP